MPALLLLVIHGEWHGGFRTKPLQGQGRTQTGSVLGKRQRLSLIHRQMIDRCIHAHIYMHTHINSERTLKKHRCPTSSREPLSQGGVQASASFKSTTGLHLSLKPGSTLLKSSDNREEGRQQNQGERLSGELLVPTHQPAWVSALDDPKTRCNPMS